MGDAAGKHDHGGDHAEHHADGEVAGDQGGGNGDHHDDGFGHRHEFEGARVDGVPVDRAKGDDDHDGDERGHRDDAHNVAERQQENQQEHAGQQGGQAGAGAGFAGVDQGLADHGAATHAAEEAGDDVGHALAPGFAGFVGVGVGDVVDKFCGHERFQQAHDCHSQRVRRDDLERLPRQRHMRDHHGGEGAG